MKAYKGGKSSSDKKDIDQNLLRVIQQYEKEGKHVVPNESENKYSEMLLELVKPYYKNLPDIDELEWLLDIATIAWNVANVKKILPQAYKLMLSQMKENLADDKEAIKMLEKMIREKEKKFAEHEMFIHDFEVNSSQEGMANITVMVKPFESFMYDSILEDEEESEEDGFYNFQPAYINRNAFIVKPLQPFLDWLKKTDENFDVTDAIDEHNIYLIGERDNNEVIEKWLKKNFDAIFQKELDDWCIDERLWPQNRTYKMFREWFTIEYHSMVYDLEDYPVDKDMP
ncbi:MAG: hypothetical protein ICV51_09325 [Flavisolibacter sp.]|nr:hypothetical protein [Flavisolibacter sp.]